MQRITRELSEQIGIGETLELLRRWGGRELYVPVKVASGDPLALTLGLATARQLVEHRGGQRLQLPAERNALMDLRNAAIVAEYDDGASHEKIGIRYGLTRQAIAYVLRSHRDREEIRVKYQETE